MSDGLLPVLRSLVGAERAAELSSSASEISQSYRDMELAGVAIRRLRLKDHGSGLGGRAHLHLALQHDIPLPDTRITTGDIVQLRAASTVLIDTAVVIRLQSKVISLSCDYWDPAAFDHDPIVNIIKIGNEITFRRCDQALNDLDRLLPTSPSYALRSVLLGDRPASLLSSPIVNPSAPSRAHLNDGQVVAVNGAASTNDVFIVHGPPGCGKTTVVTQIIIEAARSGLKVLACAPSNIAVDGLVERLSSAGGVRIVRVGHPARLLPSVLRHSLDELVSRSEGFNLASDVRTEIRQLYKRGLNGADRHDKRREMKALKDDLRVMEARAIEEVVGGAQVVLTTCVGAGGYALRSRQFDLVLIDEAGQAIEPQCWIPILHGRRLVMAGDHLQLAPTLKSNMTVSTMFQRVHSMLEKSAPFAIAMITEQYRMHRHIQDWSSTEFYQGRLQAHATVAAHLLSHLPGVRRTADTTRALVWIDTSGCDGMDEDDGGELSRGNPGEAMLVGMHVLRLLSAGLRGDQIGVLAPYNRQVGLCRGVIRDLGNGDDELRRQLELIEVGTVDGFQGREKEAIILSMVRSNIDAVVGFLADQRRTNVAVTRARRHLTVICNATTISRQPFLARLLTHLERYADYRSASLYVDRPDLFDTLHDEANDDALDLTDEENDAVDHNDDNKTEPSTLKSTGGKARLSAKERRKFQPQPVLPPPPPALRRPDFDEEAAITQVRALQPGEEIAFPAHLSSFARMRVHEMAETLGYEHGSSGHENQRFVWVKRAKIDPSAAVSPPPAIVNTVTDARCDQSDTDVVDVETIAPARRKKKKAMATDDIERKMSAVLSPAISTLLIKSDANSDESDVELAVVEESQDDVAPVKKQRRKKKKKVVAAIDVNSRPKQSAEDGIAEIDRELGMMGIRVGKCAQKGCDRSTKTVSVVCEYCKLSYCMSHGQFEVHGCDDAARSGSRSKWIQTQLLTKNKTLNASHRQYVAQTLNSKVHSLEDGRTSHDAKEAAAKKKANKKKR